MYYLPCKEWWTKKVAGILSTLTLYLVLMYYCDGQKKWLFSLVVSKLLTYQKEQWTKKVAIFFSTQYTTQYLLTIQKVVDKKSGYFPLYLGSQDTSLRVTEEKSHFFCPLVQLNLLNISSEQKKWLISLTKIYYMCQSTLLLANFIKWTKKVADFTNKKSLYVSEYTVGLASLGQQLQQRFQLVKIEIQNCNFRENQIIDMNKNLISLLLLLTYQFLLSFNFCIFSLKVV